MDKKFSEIIKNIPKKPGVYRYYSSDDTLLYIGKAINLKNRVSSYFQEGRPQNQRLTIMINQIDRIEYTVVKNEKESLILESNLIKNLQPKYNIMLKDDTSYTFVEVTNHQIPAIFLTRKKINPKSRYYGPYTNKSSIREILRALRIIFPYCQNKKISNTPCEYVSIKLCDGICCGEETKEEYLKKIEQIENILKGKTKKAEKFIKNKIEKAIEKDDFALASFWRDRLNLLKDTLSKSMGSQSAILPKSQNLDIVTLIIEESENGLQIGSVFVQTIREGKMINVNNFLLTGSEDNKKQNQDNLTFNFLQRFLSSYYMYKSDEAPVLVQAFESSDEN